MNLRQLRYFVHIAEAESVSRAAEHLSVSQSALSARIKELEEELGRDLFSRNSRGVKLTADGRTLLPLAHEALNAFRKVRHAFAADEDRKTKLAVGVTPTLGMMLIPQLVSHRTLSDADVRFLIRQGSSAVLGDLLEKREIDAIVTYNENLRGIHSVFPLITDRLVLVGSEHHLDGMTNTDRDVLSTLPFVAEPPGHILREKLDAFFNVGSSVFEPIAELDPFEARRALVLSGDACAIAPKWLFDADLREGRIVSRTLDLEALSLNMSLIVSIDLDDHCRSVLLQSVHRALEPLLGVQPNWIKRFSDM